jgi:hypothetical protein
MAENIQKEANNFIDKKYFTKEQRAQLKEAKNQSPEAVEKLKNKFDKANPLAKAARENMNHQISEAKIKATNGLALHIENIGPPKVENNAIKANWNKLTKNKLTKKELVKVMLREAIKANKLEHRSDKITQHLENTLLALDIEKLRDPKLQENLTKSLRNTKQLNTKKLGAHTVSGENLKKVSTAISQGKKVKKRSIKDIIMRTTKTTSTITPQTFGPITS